MADKDAEQGIRAFTANGVIYGVMSDGQVVSDNPPTTWPEQVEHNTSADDP